MDLTAFIGILWQVSLILALICLILLLNSLAAIGRLRISPKREATGAGRVAEARIQRKAGAGTHKRAGALKEFSIAKAKFAMYLKRPTSAVLRVLGKAMSSLTLTKQRKRGARIPERFSSGMAEYAMHLKNHASAINGLSQVSQELKMEVSRQHRILKDMITAIEQAPARIEPGADPRETPVVSEPAPLMKEEPIAKLEEENQIPGHFRYHRQRFEEQEMVAKEAPAKKPGLATRHTLATKEAIAAKAHLVSTG